MLPHCDSHGWQAIHSLDSSGTVIAMHEILLPRQLPQIADSIASSKKPSTTAGKIIPTSRFDHTCINNGNSNLVKQGENVPLPITLLSCMPVRSSTLDCFRHSIICSQNLLLCVGISPYAFSSCSLDDGECIVGLYFNIMARPNHTRLKKRASSSHLVWNLCSSSHMASSCASLRSKPNPCISSPVMEEGCQLVVAIHCC